MISFGARFTAAGRDWRRAGQYRRRAYWDVQWTGNWYGFQGIKRLAFSIMLPVGRKDLVTRYFAARTGGAVIIAGFDHGQGGEAVRGKCACAAKRTKNCENNKR